MFAPHGVGIITSRSQKQNGIFQERSAKKQKIFLYKEDFTKFQRALDQVVNHVKTELLPDFDYDRVGSSSDSAEPEEE